MDLIGWMISAVSIIAELQSHVNHFKRHFIPGVTKNDLVLDVGSGGNPHLRADVICDKFVEGLSHRDEPFVRDGRPLVIGDVHFLPFRDSAFDFVICSHLLEHLDGPHLAIAQLQRVAPRGYIEIPDEWYEKTWGRPFHKWFIHLEDGRLIFTAKKSPVFDNYLTAMSGKFARKRGSGYLLFDARNSLRFVSLWWQEKVPFEIRGKPSAEAFSGIRTEGGMIDQSLSPKFFKALLRWLLMPKKKVDIWLLLACPFCHGRVYPNQDRAVCSGCSSQFPIRDGVPVLLREKVICT